MVNRLNCTVHGLASTVAAAPRRYELLSIWSTIFSLKVWHKRCCRRTGTTSCLYGQQYSPWKYGTQGVAVAPVRPTLHMVNNILLESRSQKVLPPRRYDLFAKWATTFSLKVCHRRVAAVPVRPTLHMGNNLLLESLAQKVLMWMKFSLVNPHSFLINSIFNHENYITW